MTTDEELVLRSQKNDEEATNNLLNKYKNLVNKISRSYFLIGGDIEDIVQEGMIGLYKAITHFSPQKNASFKTFASICIKNQIQSAIKIASSEKNRVLSSALSIADDPCFDEEEKLGYETISDFNSLEDKIVEKENVEEILFHVKEKLSPLEKKIFNLYLEGYNYNEISQMANISKKSIDNGLTRIKSKLSFLKNEK